MGWAYLAGATPEERWRATAQLAHTLGGAWPETERRIEEAREHYARHGSVLNLRHYHPDINAIGVPVTVPGRRLAMALNCGGALSVASSEKLSGPIAGALKELATHLSALQPPD